MSESSLNNVPYDDDDDKPRTPIPKHSVFLVLIFHLVLYSTFRGLNGRYPSPVSTEETKSNPRKFSEENAVRHLGHLTSLGHRPAGSEANEVFAVQYLVGELRSIQKTVKPAHFMEIDVQEVSGTFDLGFLKHFSQYYENVKNILVRFEPNPRQPSTNYILINCHFDTVPQSPGASDDAASCCIMLESLRALAASNESFQHGLVFNFNGAEENILQASHGFITQHPWAKNIKAFVNLEGAGGGGWELLFQSGPQHPWLLKAYATSAPHPFAHAMAQDIFQSGVIPSDTDYRIYRDFGRVPGLDIAYMSNGYIYHTKWDDVKQIPPGCLQRGGDNILGLLTNLLDSPFVVDPGSYKFGKVVFFDVVGLFMVTYSEQASLILNWGFGLAILASIGWKVVGGRLGDPRRSDADLTTPLGRVYLLLLLKHLGIFLLGALASIVVPIVIGAVLGGYVFAPLAKLLESVFFPESLFYYGSRLQLELLHRFFYRPMSWYGTPANVVGLFLLPSATTMLFVVSRFTADEASSNSRWRNRWHLAEASSDGVQLIYTVCLLVFTHLNILSSYVFLLATAFPFCSRYLLRLTPRRFLERPYLCLGIKFLALSPLGIYLTQLMSMLFEVFVPIMGRVGSTVPSDVVIAALAGLAVVLGASFWYGVIFVVERRHVRFLLGVMTSAFLLHLGLVLLTPLGFAYNLVLPHPKPQRAIVHHVNFVNYDAEGRPSTNPSSRIWYLPFDAYGKAALEPFVDELRAEGKNGPTTLTAMPAGRTPIKAFDEEEFPAGTSRPFWGLPYFFPTHTILKESYLLSEVEPFKPPYQISLKLLDKVEVQPGRTRISLAIDTHDHTSVMLSPRPGYVVANWSAGDANPGVAHFIPGKSAEEDRLGYFIFYGFGRKPDVKWKLDFDVVRVDAGVDGVESSENRPIVEVSVNPHFVHGPGQITAELQRFLDKLPEWCYCLSWSVEQHLMTV